jgi:putative protease
MSNTSKKRKLELLAPAGNMEKLETALAFGADAVYAGLPDFSLRARINDFDFQKLKQAIHYVHEQGKKIYVTANIFAHDRHLSKLRSFVRSLSGIGPDALIVSDPGVLLIIREEWPEADIHLSTQANCTNWQAARFWQAQGVSRIVLGREVSLPEIRTIHKHLPDLELEYFVHGAMCMSYSGRCFLSKLYTGRSANLGDCVQPCRWPFEYDRENYTLDLKTAGHDEVLELVEEEHGSYLLNSKDLCLLPHLYELVKAGVTSFKIEGRAKSVYYQAVVNAIYRRALDGLGKKGEADIAYLFEELKTKLTHRGYTSGFLLGDKADENTVSSHLRSDWEFCGQSFMASDSNQADDRRSFALVKVHNTIKKGDRVEIVRPGYDILSMEIGEMIDVKSGQLISEAHGGQDFRVLIPVSEPVPALSVWRRYLGK